MSLNSLGAPLLCFANVHCHKQNEVYCAVTECCFKHAQVATFNLVGGPQSKSGLALHKTSESGTAFAGPARPSMPPS